MKPNESGRCPYCGSEDIEEYYDSTAECHEGRRARRLEEESQCGARWYWRCTY